MFKIFKNIIFYNVSLFLLLFFSSNFLKAEVEIGGRKIKVVDLHLHAGFFSKVPNSGREFINQFNPDEFKIFLPAVSENTARPYPKHTGIKAQTKRAGIDHAILLAVYVPKTIGTYTNSELLNDLENPQNKGWAFGFASIDVANINDQNSFAKEVHKMDNFIAKNREKIIGIKMAHPHHWLKMADERLWPVYQVAGKHKTPVLIHTGMSGLTGVKNHPEFYDPIWLEKTIKHFNGKNGSPRVNFVLSHIGNSDKRAVNNAINLGKIHQNVYFEISVLQKPFLLDEKGKPIASLDSQYPYILKRVKELGLIHKTLFGSDGPSYSGMVKNYVTLTIDEMKKAKYSLDEIEKVLSGNFFTLFNKGK